MKLIFWDLELLKPLESNGGWAGAKSGACGISVVCLYDSETRRYYLSDQTQLDEAVEHLNSADILVGFNTIDFDTVVIQNVTGRFLTVQQYDFLQAIWDELGFRQKGWKLEQVSERTLGLHKAASGKFATQMAQDGEWGRLFTYCLWDVMLLVDLWNHLSDDKPLIGPTDDELFLTLPAEVRL